MADYTTIYNGLFDDSYCTGSLTIDDTMLESIAGNQYNDDLSKIRQIDRNLWAGAGRLIFSEARDYNNQSDQTHPARSWKNNSYAETGNTKDYLSIRTHGVIHTIPPVFPGSANYTGIHDGTTDAKGFLVVQSLAKNSIVSVKIRKILIAAKGVATVGAWNSTYLTHSSTTKSDWRIDYLCYPSGTIPGNTIELQVAYKQNATTDPAYLSAIMIYEPQLSTVA